MLTQPSMELSLFREVLPTTSSASFGGATLGTIHVSHSGRRVQRILRLQEAFNAMGPARSRSLDPKAFRALSLSQTALELGIEESVAGKRDILALKQLKQILASQ